MLMLHFFCVVAIAAFHVGSSTTNGAPKINLLDVPVTVLQELLKLTDESVIDGRLDDYSREIYRPNGGEVAYYEFTFNNQYIIVANSQPTHVDKIFVSQGPLPSPTQTVDGVLAREKSSACLRYILVAPDGPVACESKVGRDGTGTVTAGSEDWIHALSQSDDRLQFQNANGSIDWNRAFRWYEVQLKEAWRSSENEARRSRDVIRYLQTGSNFENDTDTEEVLSPGQTIKILKSPFLKAIHLHVDQHGTLQYSRLNSESSDNHRRVCEILSNVICKPSSSEVFADDERESLNGLAYVAITVTTNTTHLHQLFKENRISLKFNVTYSRGGPSLTLRYGTDRFRGRAKRTSSSSGDHSSIPYETEFPDYHQFKYGKCYVGCGPVAWAMILGYMNRISNLSADSYRPLYPYGAAPAKFSESDSNLKRWIESLHDALGTICLFGQGATLASKMHNIATYYKDIQPGGLFEEERSWWNSNFLVASYADRFRDAAIGYILQGSPAVLGWKSSGIFSQHYPVATKFRKRARHVRTCSKSSASCSTDTEYEIDFYLHMGWGGAGNGWKKAQAYYAATLTK